MLVRSIMVCVGQISWCGNVDISLSAVIYIRYGWDRKKSALNMLVAWLLLCIV